MKREELTRYLDELLEAGRFRDYCPNGLQVEGKAEIGRLVAGVTAVYGGEHCTFSDSERFYSYRRDGQTGRMASIVWLAP